MSSFEYRALLHRLNIVDRNDVMSLRNSERAIHYILSAIEGQPIKFPCLFYLSLIA